MNGTGDQSIPAIFLKQVEKYGEKACVVCKQGAGYRDISWDRMGDMVNCLASFLIFMGVGKGDHVAIFSPNRYEWWVSDLAVLSIGAIDVPVYSTDSAEETFYVLNHSGAKACFVGTKAHLEKVLQTRDRLPDLEFIVVYESGSLHPDNVISFADALKLGRTQPDTLEFNCRISAVRPSDPATIIYTSGTTGPPKGVVLSHANFISNVRQILEDFQGILSDDDVFLSFLPLSHALERTAGYYLPISIGARVAFAEDFSKLQLNLVEVRPTVMISVPRLYEKIHAGILSKIKQVSPLKRVLIRWGVSLALQNVPYVCTNSRRTGAFAIKYRLAEHLIFSRLKVELGMNRIRLAVSGGGPLSKSDAAFFLGMGIVVLEGYGLTETSPVTHVNRPWLIKPGTVGPPLRGTTIKFSCQGEVLIKGPQVMMEYYKDEKATREAFTEEGFLRSGDIGTVDKDGYLSITGRIKDIIITAGGKNISPQLLENRMKRSMFIEQASVIGDRKKYLTALIIPAWNELKQWAETKGIVFTNHEELVQDGRVIDRYEKEIEKCMHDLARVEKIKKFRLLTTEWSQETGELTPTLKIKRNVVEEKYRELIDQMYLSD